jgi:DNA-binding Lrp family transcriptional regulator
MHLSGLSREVGISVPVASRHIKILEDAGLIKKRVFGNVYLLKAKITNMEKALEPFVETSSLKIKKNNNISGALKQIPGIEVKKVGNHQYITSIDGDKGYYIYEVDGKIPKKPIDEYYIDRNLTLNLKKLISVKKKKIKVDVINRKMRK